MYLKTDDNTCTLCCSSGTDQCTDNYIKGRLKLCDQLYVALLLIPLIILSQKSSWRRSSYISGVNKLQTARGGLFTCICWVSCLRIVPPKCNLICISWYVFPKSSDDKSLICHILGWWKKLFKIYSQGDAFSQMQSNVITLAKIEKTLNKVLQNFELHFKFIFFFPYYFVNAKTDWFLKDWL